MLPPPTPAFSTFAAAGYDSERVDHTISRVDSNVIRKRPATKLRIAIASSTIVIANEASTTTMTPAPAIQKVFSSGIAARRKNKQKPSMSKYKGLANLSHGQGVTLDVLLGELLSL